MESIMIKQDVFFLPFSKPINFFRKMRVYVGYWFIATLSISQRNLDPVPSIFNKIKECLLKPFFDKKSVTQILVGQFSFQLFRVAHELGLFDYLNAHPGATISEIAQALKIEQYPAEILLLGLCGLKVIKKIGNSYYISGIVKVITQDKNNKFTHFLPTYLQYMHHLIAPGINYLHESIINNSAIGLKKLFGNDAQDYYYELSKNETANEHFINHMSAFSQINAERLANHPVFAKINTLLDIGGSTGDVAISIAQKNPNLKITVYDHPSVAEAAEQNFKKNNLDLRLNAIGANILRSQFPENYEGILFSHFIDIFSPEENIEFFKRSIEALKSNGHIIVYTPVVNNSQTGPIVNCLLGTYFLCLANGKGRFYSCAQIASWMETVGFKKIKTSLLPSSEAIIVGIKKG